MSTRLNLSSKPFRNRALPWTITTLIAVASIIALVFIARSTFQVNAEAQSTERDVVGLRTQAAALNKRAAAIQGALTPEQIRTLKYAHALVDRKRFSWSRLFADLESALPGSVRVARIGVKDVGTQNDRMVAILELTVVSKDPATITQMIESMEREGIFQADLTQQNLKRGKGEVGEEYEMTVRYTPRAGVAIDPSEKSTRPVDTAPGSRKTQ